jgi:UDP-N-acetyl-D-mannosaminuronic acid transferase (WecB/TagA/CpsF family)
LLEEYKKKDISQIRKAYQDAIHDADVVLPDGIALQIFYFLARKKWLSNLNGTDFAPYLLEQLVKKH